MGHRKSIDLDLFGTLQCAGQELIDATFMALKSLAYFDDAEQDMMPDMFIDTSWEDIKKNILANITSGL